MKPLKLLYFVSIGFAIYDEDVLPILSYWAGVGITGGHRRVRKHLLQYICEAIRRHFGQPAHVSGGAFARAESRVLQSDGEYP